MQNAIDRLSRRVAVVGVGTTAFGKFPEKNAEVLATEALGLALADSGLERSAIDGLVLHVIPNYQRVSEMLGVHTRYMSHPERWGAQLAVETIKAIAALDSGLVNYVAMIWADDPTSRKFVYGGKDLRKDAVQDPYEPWGYTAPVGRLAMLYQRYKHFYGSKPEHLAEIALTFRRNANANPNAIMYRKPLTRDEYFASPFIVEPLRRFDCCQVNDGAVCLILTTKERAADTKKPPVYIAGFGQYDDFEDHEILWSKDFGFKGMQIVGEQAYRMSGLTPKDVDVLAVYDHFTPNVLFQLEGFDFCPKGEAGPFIMEGNLGLKGSLPTNTGGGSLSEAYTMGWTHVAECVRQLRGECGERQVKDAKVAQRCSSGPPMTTLIFSR